MIDIFWTLRSSSLISFFGEGILRVRDLGIGIKF